MCCLLLTLGSSILLYPSILGTMFCINFCRIKIYQQNVWTGNQSQKQLLILAHSTPVGVFLFTSAEEVFCAVMSCFRQCCYILSGSIILYDCWDRHFISGTRRAIYCSNLARSLDFSSPDGCNVAQSHDTRSCFLPPETCFGNRPRHVDFRPCLAPTPTHVFLKEIPRKSRVQGETGRKAKFWRLDASGIKEGGMHAASGQSGFNGIGKEAKASSM